MSQPDSAEGGAVDLDAIRARLNALGDTPPWYYENGVDKERNGFRVYDRYGHGVFKPTRGSVPHDRAMADFFINARQDIPALLAEVDRLRALLAVTRQEEGQPAKDAKRRGHDDAIDHVRVYWFIQGGAAQFGHISLEASNADEIVSEILSLVRKQHPPALWTSSDPPRDVQTAMPAGVTRKAP
jgi:hypothetical protein